MSDATSPPAMGVQPATSQAASTVKVWAKTAIRASSICSAAVRSS